MKYCPLIAWLAVFLWIPIQGNIEKKALSTKKSTVSPKTAARKAAPKKPRKKSRREIELENSITVLEKMYSERKKRGDGYHAAALRRLDKLIQDSRAVLKLFQQEEKFGESLLKSFEDGHIPREKLHDRQKQFSKETAYIDRLSDALIDREKIKAVHQQADRKYRDVKAQLDRKKIEYLETEVKLGGNKK